MEDMIKLWLGKKIYARLKNSNRAYSGDVIFEDENSITIRDIKGHLVKLNFDELGLLQEEF